MNILIALAFLVLGLFVGSFLNVVVLRWGTERSFIFGRSVCAHTGEVLAWYDLVPVVSFVLLRGKSRYSKEPLSLQYPVVEIITGLLFALTYWKLFGLDIALSVDIFSILLMFLYLVMLSILVVIAFYDLRTKIIPDPLVYSFILLSGLTLFLQHGAGLFTGAGLLDLSAGVVLWFPFAFLWFISKGTWMGYGDAKLAWGIGWFLGLVLGLSAIVLSFWIGAVVSLLLIGLKKLLEDRLSFLSENLTIKSEVPFAPFLVLGTLIVFFFNINVFLFF